MTAQNSTVDASPGVLIVVPSALFFGVVSGSAVAASPSRLSSGWVSASPCPEVEVSNQTIG